MPISLRLNRQPVECPSAAPPKWDAQCRSLLVGQRVVKEFRVPSHSQEAILAAFEEEGWPHHIDDPLPPVGDIEPKSRLHDTIKRLNRHHKFRLIRFHGNGNGEGVCWRYVDGANPALTVVRGTP